MIQKLKKNLAARVFLAFLAMGLIPYMIVMFYLNYLVGETFSKEQKILLQTNAKHSKILIQNRISQLEKELEFMASLEVFNDMLTNDLDSRIVRLLEKKAGMRKPEKLFLYALDTKGRIVAASQKKMLHKHLEIQNDKSFIKKDALYMVRPLYSSFNHQKLGWLVAKYPLENLRYYIASSKNIHYKILKLSTSKDIPKDAVAVEFEGVLGGYALVYYSDTSLTRELMVKSVVVVGVVLILGAVLIYFLSKRLTRQIVSPIVELTNISKEIVQKGDYNVKIESKSEDEVGALANIFNLLTHLQVQNSQLLQEVRQASEAKSAFISGMSHELRTPLNAITGFSQYLMEYENLPKNQYEIVHKIELASQHLLSLINEVLDIAKIEAGKMEIEEEEVELSEILEECVELVSPLAAEKNLKLHLFTCKATLTTDPKRLKQILINLLSNAVKFTNEGEVRVACHLLQKQIRIDVRDTGIGIAQEDLERVFENFTQLRDANTSKNTTGSGLGLALCKKIALALGFELSIESEGRGRGSVASLLIHL